jgi:hypothetical protein
MFKSILSYHTNTWGCGIAKFNQLLGLEIETDVVSFQDWLKTPTGDVLLSISIKEFSDSDCKLLRDAIYSNPELNFSLMLHSFEKSELEIKLCELASNVYALNEEINHSLVSLLFSPKLLYTPSLLDNSMLETAEDTFELFTFGMAHKMMLELVDQLILKLREVDTNPVISISTALHVNEQPLDTLQNSIVALSEAAKVPVNFLGFLSDQTLRHEMEKADGFFRFFEGGVRSNSTSIMASMAYGCCTFTNLDEYSPKWMIHGENVVDVNLWNPSIDLIDFRKIGMSAKRDYCANVSWKELGRKVN